MRYLIYSLMAVFFSISFSTASVINIPTDIDSIQGGINIANSGDTVLVQPGIYSENIDFGGKSIIVGSLYLTTGDTSYIEQTIIDGNQNGSVAKFENGEDTLSVLCGFTLQNGSGTVFGGIDIFYLGGGIFCENYPPSSPTLKNLIIKNNNATEGGGIYCGGDVKLIDLIIKNNWVYPRFYGGGEGGGICCFEANPILQKVTIFDNYAPYWGGGISCYNSDPVLINVTISLNYIGTSSTWQSGGIHCIISDPILVNSIIWNNSPNEIELHPFGSGSSVTIAFTDLKGGQQGIVTNSNGTINWLNGNIDLDPLFVNSLNRDFHLQSSSPCIDSATALFVLGNDTLVNMSPNQYSGLAPDMGAFEYEQFSFICDEGSLPNKFMLYQNYPNPFNPNTTISFHIPFTTKIEINLYNLLGQKIKTIYSDNISAGKHQLEISGVDLSSGVYYYELKSNNFRQIKKCILIR